MQRLATTVAIAAWLGFLGVFSLELLVGALAPDVLAAASLRSWPPAIAAMFDGPSEVVSILTAQGELPLAVSCLAIMAALGFALHRFHVRSPRDPGRAERAALAAFAAIALLAAAGYLLKTPLLPVDLDGGLIWLALGLSLAALLFDRLVAIEADDPEAEADLAAGVAAIAQSMARPPRIHPSGARRGGDAR